MAAEENKTKKKKKLVLKKSDSGRFRVEKLESIKIILFQKKSAFDSVVIFSDERKRGSMLITTRLNETSGLPRGWRRRNVVTP